MLDVTDIDFPGGPSAAGLSGRYITDANGAMIADAHRYDDPASGLRTLSA